MLHASAAGAPPFPTLTLQGRSGVIRDCGLEAQVATTTSVASFPVIDDYYLFSISINGLGVVINNATFLAKYSRTWMEATSAGPVQVWRFLVNADVTYALNASSVPGVTSPLSSFPPYNLPVHFNGAVDYVRQCGTTNWNVAYWLTHGCPTEMHAPWSQVPIAAASAWPSRTYHFVAPANFNFNAIGPGPTGNILGEAGRTSGFNTANVYQCSTETPVIGGNISNSPQYCQCLPASGTALGLRNTDHTLNGFAACVGAIFPFSTIPVPGVIPSGMRSTSLGSHSFALPPGQFYPAIGMRVNAEVAVFQYVAPVPPCTQIVFSPVQLYGGIATFGTSPVFSFTSLAVGGILVTQIDLGDMLVFTGGSWQIGFGGLYISDLVWGFSVQ